MAFPSLKGVIGMISQKASCGVKPHEDEDFKIS